VDEERASATSSVGMAVGQAYSYVTLFDFASPEECSCMQDSASDYIQNNQHAMDNDDEHAAAASSSAELHVLGASQVNFNCTRASVEAVLGKLAQGQSVAWLDRLLGFLEDSGGREMSDLAFHVFGCSSQLKQRSVTWYSEPLDEQGNLYPEPKVNTYQEGGYFRRHEDGMQLTLLVVLNDAFEGGGTAFYAKPDERIEQTEQRNNNGDDDDDDDDEDPVTGMTPESICRPPLGTAIIWGGELLHMALPVTKGERSIYVGSFDLNE